MYEIVEVVYVAWVLPANVSVYEMASLPCALSCLLYVILSLLTVVLIT